MSTPIPKAGQPLDANYDWVEMIFRPRAMEDQPVSDERKEYLLSLMTSEERLEYDSTDDAITHNRLVDTNRIVTEYERRRGLNPLVNPSTCSHHDGEPFSCDECTSLNERSEKPEGYHFTYPMDRGIAYMDQVVTYSRPVNRGHFPCMFLVHEWTWRSNSHTLRERLVTALLNLATDESGWTAHVHDSAKLAQWRDEVLGRVPSWYSEAGFSGAMLDYAERELADKADIFAKHGGVVSVFDGAGVVFKRDVGDTVLLKSVKETLDALEDRLRAGGLIPEQPQQRTAAVEGEHSVYVLNIVDPSMWPLVYGKTLALRDRTINLAEALGSIGGGLVLPNEASVGLPRFYSSKYQWLPAEVELHGEIPKITSYINNLHPVDDAGVYTLIEELIQEALPLWDAAYERALSWGLEDRAKAPRTRVPCLSIHRECESPDVCEALGKCRRENCPQEYLVDDDSEDEDEDEGEDNEDNEDRRKRRAMEKAAEWFEGTHPVQQPEPREYSYLGPTRFKTSEWFGGRTNLQVIVNVTTLHMTPEGGPQPGLLSLAGHLNERICATALFVYDSHNLDNPSISFFSRANAEDMATRIDLWVEDDAFSEVYGIHPTDAINTTQEEGDVTLRNGRMVVYPNVYRTRVGMKLRDKAKPGYVKMVALHLVDPVTPIMSTANVPPQQRHWHRTDIESRLPPEVSNMVYSELDCPYGLEEAVKIREDVDKDDMEISEEVSGILSNDGWVRYEV